MKYKVKNVTTGEETLCEKVVVGGFDYYIGNEWTISESCFHYNHNLLQINNHETKGYRKVIATTNPSLDLPQVVEEVKEIYPIKKTGSMFMPTRDDVNKSYKIEGYNKAKETYQFTSEDMVEWANWLSNIKYGQLEYFDNSNLKPFTELFDIWQEQRQITINVK